MKRIALVVVLVLVASACARETTNTPGTDGGQTVTGPVQGSTVGYERPPDLVITTGGKELALGAYSYCWSSQSGDDRQVVCADGVPQDPLPSITLPKAGDLTMTFPLLWNLEAWLYPDGDFCNGGFVLQVEPNGRPIDLLGPQGSYRVELFGRGEEGDAVWAFELTTNRDARVPEPYGQVFWYPSGRDLEAGSPFAALIGNLVTPPGDVSATVSVAAGNGDVQEFPLSPTEIGTCWQGTVAFDAGAGFTESVLTLGPAPYDLMVKALIDGSTVIVEPLRWPDDFPANSNESPRLTATGTGDFEGSSE